MGTTADSPRGLARARAGVIAGLVLLAVMGIAGSSPAATPLVAKTTAPKTVEGGKATFTVSLSRAPKTTVRISYRTVAGTAKTPADFKSVTGKLTFKRGQRTKKIAVSTVNDTLVEVAERFVLKLSSPRGARLKNKTATATILDNDVAPPPPPPPPSRSLSIADVSVAEGNAGAAPAALDRHALRDDAGSGDRLVLDRRGDGRPPGATTRSRAGS